MLSPLAVDGKGGRLREREGESIMLHDCVNSDIVQTGVFSFFCVVLDFCYGTV